MSRHDSLHAFSAGALLGDWPASYEAQLCAGYARNAIAQRSVRLVAQGLGGAPITASDPAITALLAARSGGQVLAETLAAQLLLHGNAYVQLLTDGDGQLVELFALRPERVSVEPDARGWPVGYRYRVGERVTRLLAEDAGGRPQIVHLKAFNPADDHYGLGCLGAASGAIAIHNAAATWNKALLDNAARPSGALVYEHGDGSSLSREQFDRLRAEMDASFSGSGNAGRPMLLEGGLRWTPPPTASMCQSGGVEHHLREASVSEVSIIGLDIAKRGFQAHGVDAMSHVLLRKKISPVSTPVRFQANAAE